jgi:8-oxo-dGTP pyrophosphatase MutT (NUDIX family)
MKIKRPESKRNMPSDAKLVFKGKIFDVYQWEQEMYDGSTQTFERLKRPDTVVVFPVLPDGRILLADQEQPDKGPFVSALGGRVDEGEDIEEAARRELREESGYEAERLILWDAQQPVSKIEWAVLTFIAKGIKKFGEQKLDAGEKIKLKPVTFDELVEFATHKEFYDKEVMFYFMEAKYDPEKKEKLRKLFDPNT